MPLPEDVSAEVSPAEAAEAPAVQASAWDIVRTFNEISLSSFGGGLSAWSREMVVARRKWMNDAEFLSAMTICRILPGANQVNLAVFVGTKLNGLRGAAAALAGLIAMPTLLLVGIAALYAAFQHSHAVQHVLSGFAAAAVAMTLANGLEIRPDDIDVGGSGSPLRRHICAERHFALAPVVDPAGHRALRHRLGLAARP